jgi:hypothetical protein
VEALVLARGAGARLRPTTRETEPDGAHDVDAVGPWWLARACRRSGSSPSEPGAADEPGGGR